jgi:hypothetical protein
MASEASAHQPRGGAATAADEDAAAARSSKQQLRKEVKQQLKALSPDSMRQQSEALSGVPRRRVLLAHSRAHQNPTPVLHVTQPTHTNTQASPSSSTSSSLHSSRTRAAWGCTLRASGCARWTPWPCCSTRCRQVRQYTADESARS